MKCALCEAATTTEDPNDRWGVLKFHCNQWTPGDFVHAVCPDCAVAVAILMMHTDFFGDLADAIKGMGMTPYVADPVCSCCMNHHGDIVATYAALARTSARNPDGTVEVKVGLCFPCMLKSIAFMRIHGRKNV